MIINKSQIIETLSAAHLSAGHSFVNTDDTVCAVGAVIKDVLPSKVKNKYVNQVCEFNVKRALAPHAKPYIESQEYFSALSIHFENVMYHYDDVYTEEVREEILSFVHSNFPETLSISIPEDFYVKTA